MTQKTTPPKAQSLSDTAPIKAVTNCDTIVVKQKTAPDCSAAKAANKAIRGHMTYKGRPFSVEDNAFHRLMERYRGGILPSLRDMWPVLLFFVFQAGVALAMLFIELF